MEQITEKQAAYLTRLRNMQIEEAPRNSEHIIGACGLMEWFDGDDPDVSEEGLAVALAAAVLPTDDDIVSMSSLEASEWIDSLKSVGCWDRMRYQLGSFVPSDDSILKRRVAERIESLSELAHSMVSA